jgi:hypothetical protein
VKRGIRPKANPDADGAGARVSVAKAVFEEDVVNDPSSSGFCVHPPMASFMACVARATFPVRVNRAASRIAANKSFATLSPNPPLLGQSRCNAI